ncbi:hypothetical protein B0H66DRAFT_538051 [Apodospora peruviana]|uniref:Tat pathway signal sequence n=1 Tax=Apodospora peruviana TaxID=516989 RepID=A0AAE0LZ58_9PEZI|nr:hypothetical protein B0H66DRAFT_538051 [Apodospora peruviana]
MATSPYAPLSANEDRDEVSAGTKTHAPRRSTLLLILPWLISLFMTLLLVKQAALISIAHDSCSKCIWKEFEISKSTTPKTLNRPKQRRAARRQIPLTTTHVKFTGGLKILDGVGLVREIDSTLPAYVGTPSPELDAAWEDIVQPLNVFVTEKELEGDTVGTSPDPETGLYVAMPQGFHDLHCLNMIRQRLHLDYYSAMARMNRTTLDTHIDHCIDSLRQSLMCTGDMTLIRTYWIDERHRMMANFDNDHMCRDFGALKAWLRARDAEDGSTWRESADRLLGELQVAS